MPFLIVEETNHSMVSELRVSTLGKIFLAGLAASIVGRASGLKIRGNPNQIKAIANALRSSRRFQDELRRSGATVDSVMQKLNLKNARGREFERILGVKWPI